jgi:hypothetical protein
VVFADDRRYSSVDFVVNGWLVTSLRSLAPRLAPMVPLEVEPADSVEVGLVGAEKLSEGCRLFVEEAQEFFAGA